MKTALGIILALVALVTDVFAANPAFQSFDTNDFIITPSISNPKMIHVRRSGVTNSWTNSVISYSNTVILIDGINITNFISGVAFLTNYALAAGTNIVISTNVVGTNVTWTVNSVGDGTGALTNYFLEAGTNTVITTNIVGTNITWRVNAAGDGVGALTNYFLEAGSNVTLTTNVVGTNVTWNVSASGTGGSSIWTNEASTVRLITTNANGVLTLSADDGAGAGAIRLATLGTNRWTINSTGTLLTSDGHDFGSSVSPVGTAYFSPILGIFLGAQKVASGNGDPEGVVLAEVGSLWLRTNGAANSTLYTKISGSGTTGWTNLVVGTNSDDHLVFASGFDTTPGTLVDKILSGLGITTSVEGDTDDHLTISVDSSIILWTNNNSVVELTDLTLPVYITRNLGARLSVGDTAVIDANYGSQTNQVSGAMTFTHATNGVDQVELTHVRWLPNGSGSDQTLTIPSGWRTNVFSPVPSKLTNGTITCMYVKFLGPTDTLARQTNALVSWEYYK